VWSKHHEHLYFPDVEKDNPGMISTWARTIMDKSVPFYLTILNLILAGDCPRDNGIVVFDNTVSAMVQNGVGSKKLANTSISIVVTDLPLINSWDSYIQSIRKLSSSVNGYKFDGESQPVSSLMNFGEAVAGLWTRTEDRRTAMSVLLPGGRSFFLESITDLVQQITRGTSVTRDAVVKVLDNVILDGVTLIANEAVCGLQLRPQNKQSSVLATIPYPFALLDQSIALPFDSTSQLVNLKGLIDSDMMLITDTLMKGVDVIGNFNVIANPIVSDWLLACMNMIGDEKKKWVAFLCVGSMLGAVQPFWWANQELFRNSVTQAVTQLTRDTVTTEVRRKFLQNIFIPFMEVLNKEPDVGACVLLAPSRSCDYTILCTGNMVHVGMLCRGDDSLTTALEKWLNSLIAFLLERPVDCPIEEFMEGSRKIGPDPVLGDNAAHVFDSIPADIYSWSASFRLIGTIARASVLNAWALDVPAIEIYIRRHLVAGGKQIFTAY
jgi:hypothetical protein